MPERQWPLPPAANAKDIYVWAQELTRLLTQRLNPILTAAALLSSVSVRAATTANIDISADLENGDTLDGVTLSTGDLVLVKDQTAGEENGIYKVPGSGAAKRTGDFITYDAHVGAIVTVQEGTTNGGTTWQGTSSAGGTLGTTAIAFSQFGTLVPPVGLSDIEDIATKKLLGRHSSGNGQIQQVTLTQALDFINASVAQGDILYRDSGSWKRLAAGSNGEVLTLASGVPSWAAAAAGWEGVANGNSTSVSELDIDISGYDLIHAHIYARPATDNTTLWLRMSTDGGSNFISSASAYAWDNFFGGGESANGSDSEIEINRVGVGNASAEGLQLTLDILRPNKSSFYKQVVWHGGAFRNDGLFRHGRGSGVLLSTTDAVTDIRFLMSSGNLAEIEYAVTGFNFA